MEFTHGKTAASMKVTIKTIKSMVEEPTPGKTEENTMESGSMESSTESEPTSQRRGRQKRAFGKTAKESNGSTVKQIDVT